jgi:hypothetical protein
MWFYCFDNGEYRENNENVTLISYYERDQKELEELWHITFKDLDFDERIDKLVKEHKFEKIHTEMYLEIEESEEE